MVYLVFDMVFWLKNFPHQVDLSDQEERLVKKGESVAAGLNFICQSFDFLRVKDHDKASQQVLKLFCQSVAAGFYILKFFLPKCCSRS